MASGQQRHLAVPDWGHVRHGADLQSVLQGRTGIVCELQKPAVGFDQKKPASTSEVMKCAQDNTVCVAPAGLRGASRSHKGSVGVQTIKNTGRFHQVLELPNAPLRDLMVRHDGQVPNRVLRVPPKDLGRKPFHRDHRCSCRWMT